MKGTKIWLLFAAVIAAGGTVCAQQPDAEATSAEASFDGTESSAGSWTDFQLVVDGTIWQFPMMASDWEALGWSLDESTQEDLEPYQYSLYSSWLGDRKCTAYLLNYNINNLPASDCIMAGVSLDRFDWEVSDGTVELPGGVVRGVSGADDILAAYGEPQDVYEGELYTSYQYELDYNCSMELSVYRDSGVLEDIELRNFVEPEGFDPGEVNAEMPEAVAAYEKPEQLGDDLTEYRIEMDGAVYSLPVPVSTLLADGWSINEEDSELSIAAHSFGWVSLEKDGKSFDVIAKNEADYATVSENCWIEELEIGGYSLEIPGALPGGISVGTEEEALLATLENAGMEYEVDESGDLRYYTYNEQEYDQCIEVMVYTGSDGHFQKNTVIGFSCSNAFD